MSQKQMCNTKLYYLGIWLEVKTIKGNEENDYHENQDSSYRYTKGGGSVIGDCPASRV